MKFVSILKRAQPVAAFTCCLIAANAVAGEGTVALLCQGKLTKTMDGDIADAPATVDVRVNLDEAWAETDGFWGCLSSIGEASGRKCTGRLPVTITAEQIKYSADSAGNGFSGMGGFTINRSSGTFSVLSTAVAEPRTGAKWSLMMYTAKLQCRVAKPMF